MAQKGMNIRAGPGGNRNAKNLPYSPDGREWSEGVCGCCAEPGLCLKATCCTCVVYAQNKQRYEYLQHNGTYDPEHGGGCCSGSCWLHCLLQSCAGFGWILEIPNRSNIRSRYGIKGGCLGDCCTIWCCNPCALTQESRELELEEISLGRRK
ncbi:PLAC8-domain-containing protein [Pluteus cervinus]|uniref:PLAC8-domain-containing protein n=1 Tax=Pluteus cervinus TaxID=181527 RepID=A0ACD3B3P3_9AGAR|nr:PLAC8-domain-containing protein [Pluteus cervinus]